MKKFYMTMVAMLCGVAAMAQTCTISAEPVEMVADGDLYYFDVVLNESEPGKLVTGAAFKVQFPKNGVFFRYYDEDEEDYVYNLTFPNSKSAHQTGMMVVSEDDNIFQISTAAAGSTYFKTGTNVLAHIGIKADTTAPKAGYGKIKFYDISFAAPDPNGGTAAVSVYPQEAFEVELTVEGGTKINSINANDSNAPVYNLAGQRVSKAQKGVYIQNGKKVAVK
jgi:hypothetical protein